jgi:hypothetical protein
MDIKYDQKLIGLAKEVASLAPKTCMTEVTVYSTGTLELKISKFYGESLYGYNCNIKSESENVDGVKVVLTNYEYKKEGTKNE